MTQSVVVEIQTVGQRNSSIRPDFWLFRQESVVTAAQQPSQAEAAALQ